MHNHSYENQFSLHVNETSFSYERMSTKTRFEKEAKGNSEMAYSEHMYTVKLSMNFCMGLPHQYNFQTLLDSVSSGYPNTEMKVDNSSA